MGHRTKGDKTAEAVSLIEEACLAVLIEHLAVGDGGDGLSTDEIAERIGLDAWLGRRISNSVVEKVLYNLSVPDPAAPVPEALARRQVEGTEIEASIRPMPVIDTSAPSDTDPQRNRRAEPDQ